MRFDDTLIGIKHCRDYRATASVNEGGAQYCTGMFTVRRPTVSSVTAHAHANGTSCEDWQHSWLDSGTDNYDTCDNIRICNAMKCPSSYLTWGRRIRMIHMSLDSRLVLPPNYSLALLDRGIPEGAGSSIYRTIWYSLCLNLLVSRCHNRILKRRTRISRRMLSS